jgi:hypothetical protein
MVARENSLRAPVALRARSNSRSGSRMRHYSCDVTPVGTFSVHVEQPEVRDEVFLS